MRSRSTHPPAQATTLALPPSAEPGQHPDQGRVIDFSALRTADRGASSVEPLSTRHPAVIADPCAGTVSTRRIVGPAPHDAPESIAKIECPLGAQAQLVCAADAECGCPLSRHLTDAERAVVNGIADQAARLSTALSWVFALVALAAVVLFVRWVG